MGGGTPIYQHTHPPPPLKLLCPHPLYLIYKDAPGALSFLDRWGQKLCCEGPNTIFILFNIVSNMIDEPWVADPGI